MGGEGLGDHVLFALKIERRNIWMNEKCPNPISDQESESLEVPK
jgi:hypothetical protein